MKLPTFDELVESKQAAGLTRSMAEEVSRSQIREDVAGGLRAESESAFGDEVAEGAATEEAPKPKSKPAAQAAK